MKSSDAAVLNRWLRERNAEAFAQIVQRHARGVYATCCRMLHDAAEAEDITQECFEALATVDRARAPRLLGPWLHGVATRRCLAHQRSESRRKTRELVYASDAAEPSDPDWAEIYPCIDEAVAALPEELSVPLVAHFFNGQSHTEIARAMGIPRRTIGNRIHKGLELIAADLKQRGIVLPAVALAPLLSAGLAEAAEIPATLSVSLAKLSLAQAVHAPVMAFTGPTVLGIAVALVAALTVCVVGIYHASAPDPNAVAQTLASRTSYYESTTDSEHESKGDDGDRALALPAATPRESLAAETDKSATGGVAGRVYDAESGAALPDVLITLVAARETAGEGPNARTGPDGIYSIANVPPGSYRVQRFRWGIPLLEADDEPVVAIGADRVLYDVDFPIVLGVGVTGIVVDERGEPVPHAFVLALDVRDHLRHQEVRTMSDEDGRFAAYGLKPTRNLTVSATLRRTRGQSLASDISDPLHLRPKGLNDLRLELHPTGTISGNVLDTAGRPVTGARVNLSTDDEIREQIWEGEESAANGTFTIKGVPAGAFELILLPPHAGGAYVTSAAPWDDFEIAWGEDITGVTAVLDMKSSISGVVADESGTPLAGVRVDATQGHHFRTADTNDEGRYVIYDLVDGQYQLCIGRVDGEFMDPRDVPGGIIENVATGATDANFVIERPAASLSGTVVSAATGEAIPRYDLLILDGHAYDRPWTNREFEEHDDPSGAFHESHLAPGPVTIVARADGFAETVLELAEVKGRVTSDVQLAMQPGVQMHGFVRATDGSPVAGALVFAGEVPLEFGDGDALAQTDSQGRFETNRVALVTKSIGVIAVGYAPTTVATQVSRTLANDVSVVLGPGVLVEGTIYFGDEAWPGQRVSIRQPRAGGDNVQTTDEAGQFRFENVSPGLVPVAASVARWPGDSSGERRFMSKHVEVSQAGVSVDFIFAPATASVSGFVFEEGVVASAARVVLAVETPDGEETFATKTEDGCYSFDYVPAGPATLTAERETKESSIQIQLAENASVNQDISLDSD